MKILREGLFVGERALYNSHDVEIYDSIFADGESPLKESENITVYGSIFKWKYPLWYSKNVKVFDSVLLEGARSGIWYTEDIEMERCVIEAPKTFRRASDITLTDCNMPRAQETLWNCNNIKMKNVVAAGDYFGMGCNGVYAENLTINGNYAFDGAKNIEINGGRLISKDAFWNCENVVVRDAVIIGEYLGWNSKNVTFINCTVESNQGMCYMQGLKMENCKVINTDLAFEFSEVDAEITTEVISVKNPISGKIHAKKIGELIIDPELIDSEKTLITTDEE